MGRTQAWAVQRQARSSTPHESGKPLSLALAYPPRPCRSGERSRQADAARPSVTACSPPVEVRSRWCLPPEPRVPSAETHGWTVRTPTVPPEVGPDTARLQA